MPEQDWFLFIEDMDAVETSSWEAAERVMEADE